MTKDEIIRIAREAGAQATHYETWGDVYEFDMELLERFAALIAAHEKKFWIEQIEVECNEAVLAEREACAKVCDGVSNTANDQRMIAAIDCAAAIRARSQQ